MRELSRHRRATELAFAFACFSVACGPSEPTTPPPVHLPPPTASRNDATPSQAPPGSEPFDATRFAESCPTLESGAPIRAHAALDEDPSWLRDDPEKAQSRVAERLTRFVKSCQNASVSSDVERKLILVTLPEPCGPNRAAGRAELRFLPSVAKGFLTLHIDIAMGDTRYNGDLVLDAAREPNTLCLAGTVSFKDVRSADAALDSVPPPPGNAQKMADAIEFQRSIVWPLFPWLIFPTKHERGLR